MNDNELLQAISEMMDKKLEPIQQDLSSMKDNISSLKAGQETLQKDVSTLQAGQLKIQIFLENDIDKKLSVQFDGHALNTEKIDHISETVDDIDAAMTAVDIVTKANIKEINKLKTKIG